MEELSEGMRHANRTHAIELRHALVIFIENLYPRCSHM